MIPTSNRSPSPPLRLAALTGAVCGGLALAVAGLAVALQITSPAAAQDAEAPAAAAETAPADGTPAAKAKPKPKRVVKPKPAEVPAAEPANAEARSADSKDTNFKDANAKSVESKPPAARPAAKPAAKTAAADGPLLVPAAAQAAVQWPNGARSVSESYGDWTMNCSRENGRTDCVVIQSQGDRRSGKRQFSVELRVPRDGRAEGLILMPFGMQIEPGVTFKLDDRTLGKGAPYTYCVADGCLVSISLPTVATDAMKTAQALTVTATKPSATEPPVVSVPLAGFATAFERAIAYGG